MNLTHHFLISMPQMQDPNFHHTLTYIIEHGSDGALGFIVNRKIGIDLSEVYEQMNISTNEQDTGCNSDEVYEGGPVDQEHGLVLHPSGSEWESSKDFGYGVSLSSSRDILVAMASGEGPESTLLMLGHSGWAPSQLEQEISQNAWLHCEADLDIIFNTSSEDRLRAASNILGIDLNSVVQDTGHA